MKILVCSATVFAINEHTKYGGMERLAWDFADQLSELGHEVSLFAPDDTIPPAGVSLIGTGFKAHPDINYELNAYFTNREILDKSSTLLYDVIHDFTHRHYISRMQGLDTPSINLFWHDPYIAKFPKADHNIVALSEWARIRFEEIYLQKAIVQETILVDSEKYIYDPDIKREDWFVFVGKLSHEKGALDAIRICNMIGAKLKIIGGKGIETDSDNYQKEVIRQSKDNIEYLGEVSDEVKIECLQKAKGLIYPVNQMEITSYKNMEALMCGCPVITYDRGAMGHTVESKITGFLARSPNEMISCLDRVDEIDNQTCRDIAIEKWGKENVVKNYIPLYESVKNGEKWF